MLIHLIFSPVYVGESKVSVVLPHEGGVDSDGLVISSVYTSSEWNSESRWFGLLLAHASHIDGSTPDTEHK